MTTIVEEAVQEPKLWHSPKPTPLSRSKCLPIAPDTEEDEDVNWASDCKITPHNQKQQSQPPAARMTSSTMLQPLHCTDWHPSKEEHEEYSAAAGNSGELCGSNVHCRLVECDQGSGASDNAGRSILPCSNGSQRVESDILSCAGSAGIMD